MGGRTVDGVRLCNLRRRLNSVVYFTHAAYIASTMSILHIAFIMTNKPKRSGTCWRRRCQFVMPIIK